MLRKFYVKFTLFVMVLFLLALIIDMRTKPIELPVIYQANQAKQEDELIKKEYQIYVSDFNNYIFPLTISLNKHMDDVSIYDGDIKNQMDEEIYTTFSLLTNYSNYLPKGVTTTIPPSTRLISYEINQKELTLNLNKSFLNYNENDEKSILKILTYTFTHFSSIERVKITCEGETMAFKSTEKSMFSKSDFVLNVYFNDYSEINSYIIYYYTSLNDTFYLVPVTIYDLGEEKEEKVIELLTHQNSLAVISFLDENEIKQLLEKDRLENDLEFYQYYFTFIENNIIEDTHEHLLKNVNFYEIVLIN